MGLRIELEQGPLQESYLVDTEGDGEHYSPLGPLVSPPKDPDLGP